MQPVVYLLVRIALTWLQYLERENRAFVHGTQLVLVAGAAHCWAVVYALFVAVLARVSRTSNAGYHEELLPWWVQNTERVAAFAMVIWWFTGCLRLLVHIVEDDAKILPMDRSDLGIPTLLRAARAPATRLCLAAAQAVSCAGLFVSVVLLCVALLALPGPASAFEYGLVLVAASFALPLTAVALQRVVGLHESVGGAAMAAAAETASFGPQFCVILALLDILDASSFTTRLLCPIASVMSVAATCACGYTPLRFSGYAVAPDVSELALSALLDLIAVAALTLAFTMQSWWVLMIMGAMLVVLALTCAALTVGMIREALTDLLEPIMPLQSENCKRRVGPWRDYIRVGTRAIVLLSALLAFWDVTHHVSRQTAGGVVPNDYHHDFHDDQWHHDEHMHENYNTHYDHLDDHADDRGFAGGPEFPPLVLRWMPPEGPEPPGEDALLEAAAEALGVDSWMFRVETMMPEHRLLVASFNGPDDKRPSPKSQWQELLEDKPDAKMLTVGDTNFPTQLSKALCDKVSSKVNEKDAASPIADFGDMDAQFAFAAACRTWVSHDFQHHAGRALGGDDEPDGGESEMSDEHDGGDWNEYNDGIINPDEDEGEVYEDPVEPETPDEVAEGDTSGEAPSADEAIEGLDPGVEEEVQTDGSDAGNEDETDSSASAEQDAMSDEG